MTDTKLEPLIDKGNYLIEKISISNIPDIGDKTGEILLDNLENAIKTCRQLISEGFRLTDLWSDPDVGIEFTLKKKKSFKNS